MQQQYTILSLVWLLVEQLKDKFSRYLSEIHDGCFVPFDFLQGVQPCRIHTFTYVLKRLLLNIQIRFPCPSNGIDVKSARGFIDYEDAMLDTAFLHHFKRKCPLFVSVDMFLFPDELIRHRRIKTYFVSGHFPEIQMIASEILQKERLILESFRASQDNEEDVVPNTPITLLDVFKVIDANNYPFLWNVVLKTLSVMPTSVSWEQSFSRLRNKMHENMSKETSFSFMAVTHKNPIFCFAL